MTNVRKELNRYGVPDVEGVAIEGKGVFETLRPIVKRVVVKVTKDVRL